MPTLRGAPLIARLVADLEHIPAPAFVVMVEGDAFRFHHLNPAYCAATGATAAEVEGKLLQETLTPELCDELLPEYRRCRDSAATVTFDTTGIRDGIPHSWRTSLSPLQDRDGRVIALHGLSVDLTEDHVHLHSTADLLNRECDAREHAQIEAQDTYCDLRMALGEAKRIAADLARNLADLDDADAARVDRLRRVLGATDGTVAQMLRRSSTARAPIALRPIALAPLCAELCATLDPEDRLRISYGEEEVNADHVLLHVTLRALLAEAARHARRWIEVEILDSSEGMIRLRLRDDRPISTARVPAPSYNPDAASLDHVSEMLRQHKGGLEQGSDARWHWSDALLPGQIDSAAPVPQWQFAAL